MITLSQVMQEQKNLESLCADIDRVQTYELFVPNAFYGADHVLKLYCGLPEDEPLKIIFPHGIRLSSFIWKAELDSQLPILAAYSPDHLDAQRNQAKDKIILHTASPYLYVPTLLGDHQSTNRNGTIFFPAHSSHHLTVQMDYNQIADALENLDKQYQPIKICVYWKDYLLGHHKVFLDRGFSVVSAGHIFDKHFFFRLHHLLSMHRFASSNSLSSTLFYAIASGCNYFHLENLPARVLAPSHVLVRDTPPSPNIRLRNQFIDAFSLNSTWCQENKKTLASLHSGADRMLSPNALRKVIEEADRLYHSPLRSMSRIWKQKRRFMRRTIRSIDWRK